MWEDAKLKPRFWAKPTQVVPWLLLSFPELQLNATDDLPGCLGPLIYLPLFYPGAFGSRGRNLVAGDGWTPHQRGVYLSPPRQTWLHASDGQHRRGKCLQHTAAKGRLGLVSSEANPASLAGSVFGLGGVNPLQKGGRRVSTRLDPHLSSSGLEEHPNLTPGVATPADVEMLRRVSRPPLLSPFIPSGMAGQGRDNVGWRHKQRQSSKAFAINNTLPCSNI